MPWASQGWGFTPWGNGESSAGAGSAAGTSTAIAASSALAAGSAAGTSTAIAVSSAMATGSSAGTSTAAASSGAAPAPPPFIAATSALPVADVALLWADGTLDNLLLEDDIASDPGLRTAVLLSLFTDRHAETDDDLPAADGDHRGWWADEFAPVEGDRIGSRLWLLDRSTQRPELVQRVDASVREALAWMLEDKVLTHIDVTIEQRAEQLLYAVTLYRPVGATATFRFAHVWEGEAIAPIAGE